MVITEKKKKRESSETVKHIDVKFMLVFRILVTLHGEAGQLLLDHSDFSLLPC